MLEAKKYKVLNISVVTLLGESQADHQEAGQNQTKKKTTLQYQGIVGVFLLYNFCDLKTRKGHKKTYFQTTS